MYKYSQIKFKIHFDISTHNMQNVFCEHYIAAFKFHDISVELLDFTRKEKVDQPSIKRSLSKRDLQKSFTFKADNV